MYLIGRVCSSPLPASGRRRRDRREGKRCKLNVSQWLTAGVDHKDLGLQFCSPLLLKFWSIPCCMHGRRFHVNSDVIRFSWRSLAFLGLHSICHYMQFTYISLLPLNIGLLSVCWAWDESGLIHTTKACLPWCLLGQLFRGNSWITVSCHPREPAGRSVPCVRGVSRIGMHRIVVSDYSAECE